MSVISLTSIADQYATNLHSFGGNSSIFATVNKIKPKIKFLSSKTVTINFMTRSRKFSKGKGAATEEENSRSSRRRDDILPKWLSFLFFHSLLLLQKSKLCKRWHWPKKVEIIDHNIKANPLGVKKITRERAQNCISWLGSFFKLEASFS